MTEFEKAQMVLYGKVYHFDTPPTVPPPPLFAVLREERRQFTHAHSAASKKQCVVLYAWQSYNPAAKQPERN